MFKQLDKFESFMKPDAVDKILLYGGNESQMRSHYTIKSWKAASDG